MNAKIRNRLKKISLFCPVNCANFACLAAVLRIIVTTKQIINNPYIEAVNRTELSWVKPTLLRKAAGSINDLTEAYKSPPNSGNSVAGFPRAVQFASLPYSASSGPRALLVLGNAKNATTLTTNEAKTIAYNSLFKVTRFFVIGR